MNNGNSNNLNTKISKDDIFQYINSLEAELAKANERNDYLEVELEKTKNYNDTLIKMLRTSQKAVEAAEEQIAAAKRRNDAAVKFLEEHINKNNTTAETIPAEEPAEEPEIIEDEPQITESDLTPEPDEKPVEDIPDSEEIDSVNDALGLGDIFKIFKN